MLNIALNTFRELVRSRLLALIMFFSVATILFSVVLASLSLGQTERMVLDFGLSMIEISGLIAVDEKMQVVGVGDMKAQINCIYDQMEQILAMSQATLANVVNEVMYTTNLASLVEANAARVARYAKYAPPASTGVQVSALFFPDALIEIQATAVLDKEFTR